MTRWLVASAALLVAAQVAVFSPRALPSMILAAALVVVILAAEETRVREARRHEGYAEDHVCHHGATGFDPSDPDGTLRRRSS